MSYYIYDANGYVADGPSITGWKKLRDRVLTPQGGTATHEFVHDGTTEQVKLLGEELSKMDAPNDNIETSLKALQKAVAKCEDVVILSSGVMEESSKDDLEEDKAYLT